MASIGSLSRYVSPMSIEKSSRHRRMSIELWDSTVNSTSGCRSRMALVMRPAIGNAVGITPTDNRPDSEFDVFRSRRDLLLQRPPGVEDGVCPLEDTLTIGCEPMKTLTAFDDGDPELLFELTDT